MRGRAAWIATAVPATALAVAAAGCGRPVSPTAPKKAVDDALSTLSLACGHALEATALERDRAAVRRLDRRALAPARDLLEVFRAGPSATYMGQTMRAVVSTQVSAARACGLDRTASRMAAALRGGS